MLFDIKKEITLYFEEIMIVQNKRWYFVWLKKCRQMHMTN
jgi:hypothetical protein